MIELNKALTHFSFQATSSLTANTQDYLSKNIILYFYPKDATPGCTTESENFRDKHHFFQELNTIIFGISRDSLKSHEKFKEKLALPFELISDENESICNLFDVIKEKNMYGKKYMGIERSTFVINDKGVLVYEKRKVKVPKHVDEVLAFVKTL